MTILIVIGVVIVVLFLLFILRSTSLGQSYKKYLQETQSSLLLRRFPKLTQGDLYDIQTTSAGDLVRWILQQEYSSLYIKKEYQVLEKLMDTAMENLGDYSTINEWINGRITKQGAINLLSERDPEKYRIIFNNALSKLTIHEDNRAIELDPYDADAYYNRSLTKLELGDYKGAIQDCNKAIDLNPNHAKAYSNRGVAKGELGDYRGAIQDCDKTIELNPNDGMAYNNRGLAKIFLGQKDSGCLDLSKAVDLRYKAASDSIMKHCQ